MIAEFLSQTVRRGNDSGVRPEVAEAWRLLRLSGGRAPVSVVAGRVGVTGRYLSTLFRREVGRSPKVIARLMRFESATAEISASVRRGAVVDLAAVAAYTGYSDQAHLTREFMGFAGLPPGRWVAEEFRNIQDGGHAPRGDCSYDCL